LPVEFTDASGYSGSAERVFRPGTESEVAAILREANATGVGVTIAGAGTGLTGGAAPHGGWLLSMERIAEIGIHEGWAACGAGATLRDLQQAAAAAGQMYPPDPTEWSASIAPQCAGVAGCAGGRRNPFVAARREATV
jgi:FAD/FMN-containing dehydrogenase